MEHGANLRPNQALLTIAELAGRMVSDLRKGIGRMIPCLLCNPATFKESDTIP